MASHDRRLRPQYATALDYIAWELAGGDFNDKTTLFPIFHEPKKFKGHGIRRIKNPLVQHRASPQWPGPFDAA
jgi:hypothetical protein